MKNFWENEEFQKVAKLEEGLEILKQDGEVYLLPDEIFITRKRVLSFLLGGGRKYAGWYIRPLAAFGRLDFDNLKNICRRVDFDDLEHICNRGRNKTGL
jgi:hypothetical protein